MTRIQYSVYSYRGKKCESFDTMDFSEFARHIAKLLKDKDRGEVLVSCKELKTKGKP